MKEDRQSGFSLAECLITIAIATIVLASLAGSFRVQQKTYSVQTQLTEMTENARAVMDTIAREIRSAGYNPARATTFNGVPYNANTAVLDLYQDLDGNGTISGANERITYTYSSANKEVTRNGNDGGGAVSFLNNVTAFSVAYFDRAGAATTTTANIRAVRISLTVRTSQIDPTWPHDGGYRFTSLNETVSVKNLLYQ